MKRSIHNLPSGDLRCSLHVLDGFTTYSLEMNISIEIVVFQVEVV